MAEKTEKCPVCGGEMPVHTGYVTWCDKCHWNIQPQTNGSLKEHVLSRLNKWIGSRRNTALFEEVCCENQPGFQLTLSRVLSFTLAVLWYLFILWLAWRVIAGFSSMNTFGDFFVAVALTILLLVLAPRVHRLKKAPLPRNEYPALYQVVKEAGAALGAPDIDGIVINRSFGASYTISGWRRKKLLIIGLPFFSALSGEEKLAVLAHELGHHANRDITRSSFLIGVQQAMGRLFVALYPKTDYSEMLSFLATWLEWVRKGLAYAVLGPWYLLGFAVWRDSQRAEYYADYASASVAGTNAAASALKKICYSPTFYKTLEHVAQFRYTVNLFEEYRGRIGTVPPREVERIRIITEILENAVESTHPPLRHRIAYMKEKLPSAQPVIPFGLLLEMEHEFARLEKEWESRILSDYRAYVLGA
ncbi:MAG: hypothetical protein K0Q90_4258 [Paenibacillaceae bacterium]|jgi:Zn-dependent protease with chaperone function|nr:hypothetical protein [Paenibacillaceae bacterium]